MNNKCDYCLLFVGCSRKYIRPGCEAFCTLSGSYAGFPAIENETNSLLTTWETPESCPHCGEHLAREWSYCPECGSPTGRSSV